ncbi:MAG TPA: hypothetical protein VE029_02660 [Rhizobacter sp.]|nr:hypothetical protein [Rhizobacter sp.]
MPPVTWNLHAVVRQYLAAAFCLKIGTQRQTGDAREVVTALQLQRGSRDVGRALAIDLGLRAAFAARTKVLQPALQQPGTCAPGGRGFDAAVLVFAVALRRATSSNARVTGGAVKKRRPGDVEQCSTPIEFVGARLDADFGLPALQRRQRLPRIGVGGAIRRDRAFHTLAPAGIDQAVAAQCIAVRPDPSAGRKWL